MKILTRSSQEYMLGRAVDLESLDDAYLHHNIIRFTFISETIHITDVHAIDIIQSWSRIPNKLDRLYNIYINPPD